MIKKIIGVLIFIMLVVFMPTNVMAIELEDVYDEMTSNESISFNAIRPSCYEEFDFFTNLIMESRIEKYRSEDIHAGLNDCDDSFTTCTLSIVKQGENDSLPVDMFEKEVTVKWAVANSIVKSRIDFYIKKLGNLQGKNEYGYNNQYYFDLEDLNLINYYYNANTSELDDEVVGRTISYSGTIKDMFDDANLTYAIDFRAGSIYSPFETEAFGGLLIKYLGTIYGMQDAIGIQIKEILYVPSDTELTDNALIEAAKNRIKEYMPDSDIQITAGTSFSGYTNIDEQLVDFTNIIDVSKTNGKVYVFNFGSFSTDFVIVADSSKMTNPVFLTKDLNTDVSISSLSSNVPLDAKINAKELTSGEEYNKIIKLLNVNDHETYDLSLYSDLLEDYITQLDNGTFEVRIPINSSLKNKTLVIYYVDDNDEVKTYDVTVKDGYAVFETNHFSIYTLASASSNPQTGDNVILYIVILMVCLIAVMSGVIYLRNKER